MAPRENTGNRAAPAEITVRVNGRKMQVERGCHLLRLIERMGLDRRFLIVEYNGEPIHRDRFDTVVLRDGDVLELVRPVAGG